MRRSRVLSPMTRAAAIMIVLPAVMTTACAQQDVDVATVTVLAAASLTESFTEIREAFQEANPDIEVEISFGPSSGLVSQVLEGVDADVLATANTATMEQAVQGGSVQQPVTFATNSLTVAVPAGNPAGIDDFADLARPGVLVAVCDPRVPCGDAAQQVMAASGLPIEPVTYELDVKAVLAKVILDEVDAGMVYVTDVVAAGSRVREVMIPADISESLSYPIASIVDAPQDGVGQRFIDFVLGEQAQSILAADGFGPAS